MSDSPYRELKRKLRFLKPVAAAVGLYTPRHVRAARFKDLPPLQEEHVKNCRLVPDRYKLLDQLPKGGNVAEVGVLKGDFSEEILKRTEPDTLELIDIDVSRFRTRFDKHGGKTKITVHEDMSSNVLNKFEDGHFDWIYIDGDHEYPGVKQDLAIAKKKVKRDGFIVVNDYTYYSHVSSLKYGVQEAVNELCLEDGWEMVYFALHPQNYCDVAIRRLAR